MAAREHPRQWRVILADALADQDIVNVSDTITSYLGRLPTRAEINAARRAAHGLAASGHATAYRVETSELGRV